MNDNSKGNSKGNNHSRPGVQVDVALCRGCGQPIRMAILAGENLAVPSTPVNAQPTELILPDGRVLTVFRPHLPTCKNPPGIVLPNGQVKVLA